MPAYTAGDIDARILDRLDGNSLLYDQRQRYYAANEALKVINLFAPYATRDVDVPGFSVAGQQVYPVPSPCIFPLRVYFNSRQLEKVSLRAISMRYRTWTTDTTNQGMPVQEWIPMGLNMLALHPIDQRGGQQITVNGVVEPAPLVNPTDVIVIEDEWLELAEEMAASVLQIKESSQIFSAASLLYQKFQREMKERMRWTTFRFSRYYLLQEKIREQEPADQAAA